MAKKIRKKLTILGSCHLCKKNVYYIIRHRFGKDKPAWKTTTIEGKECFFHGRCWKIYKRSLAKKTRTTVNLRVYKKETEKIE